MARFAIRTMSHCLKNDCQARDEGAKGRSGKGRSGRGKRSREDGVEDREDKSRGDGRGRTGWGWCTGGLSPLRLLAGIIPGRWNQQTECYQSLLLQNPSSSCCLIYLLNPHLPFGPSCLSLAVSAADLDDHDMMRKRRKT